MPDEIYGDENPNSSVPKDLLCIRSAFYEPYQSLPRPTFRLVFSVLPRGIHISGRTSIWASLFRHLSHVHVRYHAALDATVPTAQTPSQNLSKKHVGHASITLSPL
jgi:hypothetical protein